METFTYSIKEELSKIEYKKEELMPLLSGYLKINGVLSIGNHQKCLSLKTSNSKVAKFIYTSLKRCFDVSPSFSFSRKMKLNKGFVYQIIIKEKVDEILKSLELSDGFFSIYPKDLVLEEGLKYFLAGVFLASGTVNSPDSSNYHMQIVTTSLEDAKYLLKLISRCRNEKSMNFKMIERKNRYVLYLKKADQISTFLAFIGALDALFTFENSRIAKDYINSENRIAICMSANLQKTLKKAQEQINDIKLIQEKNQFQALNEKERVVSLIRINNPEASLSLISDILIDEYSISLSKSGVNNLFNSIHLKAEMIKNGKPIK